MSSGNLRPFCLGLNVLSAHAVHTHDLSFIFGTILDTDVLTISDTRPSVGSLFTTKVDGMFCSQFFYMFWTFLLESLLQT